MVTRSYSDTELVEQHPGIVMVGVADEERDDGTFSRSVAKDFHARDFHHAWGGVMEQRLLVGGNAFEPDGRYIVQRGFECGYANIVGCARLEFEGEVGQCGVGESNMTDHLSTALVRGHFFKKLTTTVEHTYAGGPIHLMGREYVEVSSE